MKSGSTAVWLMKAGNGKFFLDQVVLKRGNEKYFSGRLVNKKYFNGEIIVKRSDEKHFNDKPSEAKGHRIDFSNHV
jgi:hypothetical protein